jgi:hypothetical protein
MYIIVHHSRACECESAGGLESDLRVSPGMPFAGPETALASTIDPAPEGMLQLHKTMHPEASQGPPTDFQRLGNNILDKIAP